MKSSLGQAGQEFTCFLEEKEQASEPSSEFSQSAGCGPRSLSRLGMRGGAPSLEPCRSRFLELLRTTSPGELTEKPNDTSNAF